ncbi:AraC family transcriptional regulator [Clostridium cellulovorans]|uniref:Transcriptional regulator, AraC family n=1 Tax=Clostridium cellulovorans (strain ATCC 35296 / DSM 3052 / OCM 3 / 743B) TaxID=573061 RepID=D9SPM7_CLOC7|nr:AraC family transcriptional regulator [Clostridium cellulovorans]ADL50076.1 transcriptional regulator, AraC family [Clostridium cellulovorans 743B]
MRFFLSNASSTLSNLSCGNLISKQAFLHHRRNFDMYVLIMVIEGTLYMSQNGERFELGPKQYIFLKAGEEHYGYKPSDGKLSYLWVHFKMNNHVTVVSKETFFNGMLENIISDKNNSFYIMPESGEISLTQRAPLLFNQLLDITRQEMIYSNQIIDYALSLLVMEISQEFIEVYYKIKQNIPPNIARIMEWIKANYYKPITISDIAYEFGYNADYLSSLFRKTSGSTLINFINKTRIDISKSLITNYDISIKEAAYSCGFTDEKYFLKTFKKFEAMTPSQYKKAFTRKMINL